MDKQDRQRKNAVILIIGLLIMFVACTLCCFSLLYLNNPVVIQINRPQPKPIRYTPDQSSSSSTNSSLTTSTSSAASSSPTSTSSASTSKSSSKPSSSKSSASSASSSSSSRSDTVPGPI